MVSTRSTNRTMNGLNDIPIVGSLFILMVAVVPAFLPVILLKVYFNIQDTEEELLTIFFIMLWNLILENWGTRISIIYIPIWIIVPAVFLVGEFFP